MAATKRKVVEKTKVGEKPEPKAKKTSEKKTADTPVVTEAEQHVEHHETNDVFPSKERKDTCIFVKLSDGVFVDLMEIQAYAHEEGNMGRVFLKGGNSLQTPCGDELVKRLRENRLYN